MREWNGWGGCGKQGRVVGEDEVVVENGVVGRMRL